MIYNIVLVSAVQKSEFIIYIYIYIYIYTHTHTYIHSLLDSIPIIESQM